MVEKFSNTELAALRSELLTGALDTQQAAELFQMFLIGRGFGVSPETAREAVGRVEGAGCSLDAIQVELEKIALVN